MLHRDFASLVSTPAWAGLRFACFSSRLGGTSLRLFLLTFNSRFMLHRDFASLVSTHFQLSTFNFPSLNQYFHLSAKATKDNITGTSTNTPTTVTKAAGDCKPNKAMATATASSKKLLAPIIAAGAHMG